MQIWKGAGTFRNGFIVSKSVSKGLNAGRREWVHIDDRHKWFIVVEQYNPLQEVSSEFWGLGIAKPQRVKRGLGAPRQERKFKVSIRDITIFMELHEELASREID
jgi:hypothetical protein